jgi:ribokinase
MPRILVVGSLVMDFVARAERLPRPGETVLGSTFEMFPGGKGANQAVQAARLGAEVWIVGRVGDDAAGEQLLDGLRRSGVHTEFVRKDTKAGTAACCIHVDARGDNSIVIVPRANLACSRADVDAAFDVLPEADILLCQLEVPLETVEYAVRRARHKHIPVILNPAPVQPLPESLLRQVTYLTPNETEAEQLLGSARSPDSDWPAAAGRKLLARGPEQVIITLGSAGLCHISKEGCRMMPAFAVEAVDATAAGDAFNGALAMALAEGRPIVEALRAGSAAGALATTRPGAQPSLPWREEFETFLRQCSGGIDPPPEQQGRR